MSEHSGHACKCSELACFLGWDGSFIPPSMHALMCPLLHYTHLVTDSLLKIFRDIQSLLYMIMYSLLASFL